MKTIRSFLFFLTFAVAASFSAKAQRNLPELEIIGGDAHVNRVEYTYDAAGNRSERQVILPFDPGTVLPDQPDPTIKPGDGEIDPDDPELPHPGNPRPGGGRPPFAYSGWVPGLLFYRYDYLEIMNSI